MGLETVIAKALKHLGEDRYKLSLLVFERVEELTKGAKPLVDMDVRRDKLTDIAIHEIAEGLIGLESIEERE